MTRLYIIDDHYQIIEGLYSAFNHNSDNFEIVGGSLSVDEALIKIDPECVDILLLDLFIGISNPINNLTRIRIAFPGLPVVIISHESCMLWQVEMFRHVIKAYIDKGDPKSEMIRKRNIVASGEVVMPEEVAALLPHGQADNQLLFSYFTDFENFLYRHKHLNISIICYIIAWVTKIINLIIQSLYEKIIFFDNCLFNLVEPGCRTTGFRCTGTRHNHKTKPEVILTI